MELCRAEGTAATLAKHPGDPDLDSRLKTYGTILGVWLIMVPFALVHDQIIVSLSPEHFTRDHQPLFGLTRARPLAAAYAFAATVLPGIALGLTMVLVYRFGPRPPLPYRRIFRDTAIVMALAEIIAWALGLWVWLGGRTPLPETWFPDMAPDTVLTQTVQMPLYFACTAISVLMVTRAAWCRSRCHDAGTSPGALSAGG